MQKRELMNYIKNNLTIYLFISLAVLVGCQSSPNSEQDGLKMSDMRVLGTHNSYKKPIDDVLKKIMEERAPGSVRGLEYGFPSLFEQLDAGIRKLELDVVYDPEGGMYSQPYGFVELKKMGVDINEFDPENKMSAPGFKVLHIPDVDYRTQCYTFMDCLEEVQQWSQEHPNHLPITIMMNAKDGGAGPEPFVQPLEFNTQAFQDWDNEIRAAIPESQLLTPDDVRGDFETLEQAILERGWPLLEQVKGKILFLLDHSDKKMRTYIEGHPSLKGRAMFVNAPQGTPEASFMVINDPIRDLERIKEMVQLGYMVRTRADANTTEARENDYSRFEAAIESGAQIISTDYYQPDTLFGTGFHIQMEMYPPENGH